MKFSYKFSNLLGTVYRKGNVVFTPDGNSIISPVGNKITIYDLKNNKAETLPIESRFNYSAIDISPNGYILAAVNEEGDCQLISLTSKTVIHKYRFKREVPFIRFSPDGRYLAACKEHNVFVFKAPGSFNGEFNPFVLLTVFHLAHDDTTYIDWTTDSKILAVGSKDTSVKLYSMERYANFKCYSLGSHKKPIVGCFFEKDSLNISTVSNDGHLCVWECSIDIDDLVLKSEAAKRKKVSKDDDSESEDEIDTTRGEESTTSKKVDEAEKELPEIEEITPEDEQDIEKLFYKRVSRHFLCDELKKECPTVTLTSATYHRETRILVTGYSTGAFFIHELPSVSIIHSLSISEHDISTVCLNKPGDWIGIGSTKMGQLLVWEWQSETYVMKQQGHGNSMTCLSYSPDGMYIATGGHDGKVKLWNTSSGFCFVTFTEHTSSVTSLQFSHNRKFVVSASLDGSVRAFDMTRYRNFKTFTSPKLVQFSCVALDSTGQFIAAGGQDVFEIHLWSMRIGRLCEILAGHEGPVAALAFSPTIGSTALVSVSWDKTLRFWNAVESGTEHEIMQLTSEALAVAYRPDGEEVAATTLDGQISFFDVKSRQQSGYIEGRKDLGSGVSDTDMISAKKNLQAKGFNSVCYSADGSCVLAGGHSKNVCIYNVKEAMLLKKFEITQNRSLDGVDDFINRRKLTEFGNLSLIEERDGEKIEIRLPGVREGDHAARSMKPEIRVYGLEFSPTSQAWAAVTTEGLLVYSLDLGLVFDPFQLEIGITPDSVRESVQLAEFSRALMMAIKLGENKLIQYVIESVPHSHINLCVASLADVYVVRCLKSIVSILERSKHLEFYLTWINHLLTTHGVKIRGPEVMPVLLGLQKTMTKSYEELGKICDFNKYTIEFLVRTSELKSLEAAEMEVDAESLDEDERLEELMSS